MKRLLLIVIATCLSFSIISAATAETPIRPLSLEDKENIARVEAYFNKFKTMTADFMQISPEGKIAEGEFYMSRPGKIRFEYKPPAQILLVADGTWLVFHDKEINQTTRLPLYSTPFGILLKKTVKLIDDANITGVRTDGGTVRIDIRDKEKPDEGMITLVFSDRPFLFRKMLIRDATGNVTSISISSVRQNVDIKPQLFTFVDSYYD